MQLHQMLKATIILIATLRLVFAISGNAWQNSWKRQTRSTVTTNSPRFVGLKDNQLPGLGEVLRGAISSAFEPEVNVRLTENSDDEIKDAIVNDDTRSLRRALADLEEKEENDLEGFQEITAGHNRELAQIAKIATQNNKLLSKAIA